MAGATSERARESMPSSDWIAPPRLRRADGRIRRLGVELEFADLDAPTAADALVRVFGGRQVRISDYRIRVEDTELGEFLVELDFKWAHEGDPEDPFRRTLGELGSAVLPMEIVCPPIPLDQAHRLEALREELRLAGASGTFDSPFYALGAQLNPELPSLEPDYIVSALRAFILLRDWLRDEIHVAPSRRLWFFAAPFPTRYCAKVLDPGYAPDRSEMIDDYLRRNATRNREVDLLPLFAHLDEPRVRRVLPHETIKPRPTWHYRLPNALIDEREWTIGLEWNRWAMVERLAERPDLIVRHAAVWREDADRTFAFDRVAHSRAILDDL